MTVGEAPGSVASASIRGTRGVGIALAGLLLAAGCGDEPADRGQQDPVVLPDPVPQREPTSLRMVDGPPGAELAHRSDDGYGPTYVISALGTDEVVVGAFDPFRPGAFFVRSVTAGDWTPIDPPPVEGEIEPELTTVGQDAVLVGEICPDGLSPEADTEPQCPPGYEGLGVWRLDHATHEWSEVTIVPEEDLAGGGSDPDHGWSSVVGIVGVVGDAVAIYTVGQASRVLLVHLDGAVEVPYEWMSHRIQVECITASGTLVGTGGDGEGQSGNGSEMTNAGLTHLAVNRGDGWTVFDDQTFTGLQVLGCGADQISIIGETDVSFDVGEWRIVDLAGRTRSTRPIPPDAVLGESDFTFASFWDRRQHVVGTGRNRLGLVRDFGHLEMIDAIDTGPGPIPGEYPVLLPRRVTVLTRPGSPALTQELPDEKQAEVVGASALPDGRIVALVHRVTSWDSGDDEFHLLIAE